MGRLITTSVILVTLLCHGQFVSAQSVNDYRLLKTFHIQSSGGWDYLAIGPNSNRLFVSHSTQVNVLDKVTGDSIGVIPNTKGVHGIAFIPSLAKGYTSNGKLNSVTVFDLNSLKVLDQIATGENPDAIMYEPFSKKIITCNGHSKDLSVIDPITTKVIATIPVGGKPETAVSDEAGKIYVNIEDKSEIVVVNMNTLTVENQWSIAPGESPTGLAIDLPSKQLFAGCDNKLLIVIDAANGKILNKLPIGNGCDGVAYDAALKIIYASNGEGTMTVIQKMPKNAFKVLGNVTTKKGARTIAIDEQTHHIYLPTAEFTPSVSKEERPKMIPGTFQVLVFGTKNN